MQVKVNFAVENQLVKEDVIEIDDYKLEELTKEEIESAIEVMIRNWANRFIKIEWEVLKSE